MAFYTITATRAEHKHRLEKNIPPCPFTLTGADVFLSERLAKGSTGNDHPVINHHAFSFRSDANKLAHWAYYHDDRIKVLEKCGSPEAPRLHSW